MDIMEKTNGQALPEELKAFLTIPGEEFLIVKRKHWFLPAFSIGVVLLISLGFLFSSSFVFFFLFFYPALFLVSLLTIFVIATTFITKAIIDWYYHLYLVTNRKILEMTYSPLASLKVNDVLLDQVRCTEIDAHTDGIVNEFLNLGDVSITFDRPTHQEELLLSSIENPRETSLLLATMLMDSKTSSTGVLWYRNRKNPRKLFFSEEIPNQDEEAERAQT